MAELPLRSQANATGTQTLADKLEKPSLDNRTYRVIKLSNDLEALLIHDPDTDKSAAALDVAVGSFSDADDLPGMAHAVEHLLFMGTEKYPGENDYNAYLSKYGGHSNAFTAPTSTNYYFELSSSATSNSPSSSANVSKESLASSIQKRSPLYGGLDRFAQFFVHPLFLEDTLDRELRAVDSENKKNLQSDNWRMMQLNRSLANKKHPYNKFATGNYKVLHDDPIARGVKIREAFIGFYKKHYSANRMKLAVLGKESLDELQGWVEELFSAVPNQDLPQLRWDGLEIYSEKEIGTQVFMKPVMDRKALDLYFVYPDEQDLWESQPSRYLSHLIGHEGPGSILAYLKAKGWADGLSAGGTTICPGSGYFAISFQLTEAGLENYREILKTTFYYISMLKEEPIHQWIFDEMKKLQEVDFRFREKAPASRTVSHLSGVMQKPYPRPNLLSGQTLLTKFNPEAIKRGLAHLHPENFRFYLVDRNLETDSQEQWYGTDYKLEKIPEDFMQELKRAHKASRGDRPADLRLPGKNEFVPQRLDVEKKEVATPSQAPKLVRNTEGFRTWFKKDDQFWVPRANVFINIRTPAINVTPFSSVSAHMHRELVVDSLTEYAYDADLAGLDYNIGSSSIGYQISVSGYNDKLPVLLEKVLSSFRNLEIKQDRFDVIKQRVTRDIQNMDYAEPYHQISRYLHWIGMERKWLPEELGERLKDLTADDVRAFVPLALKQTHVEILVHGNVYREDALRITDIAQSTLKTLPLSQSQWPSRRVLDPQPGSNFACARELANKDNVNHCINYQLSIGANPSASDRAKLLLLAQMTNEPAFDQLRTKEQLGYIVGSGPMFINAVAGFRVLIQSEKDCEYLETRIDAWLESYAETLKEMSERDFEEHKISLINKRLEKLKNLGQEAGRFWTHISGETLGFDQVQRDVESIEPLTKEDMIEFYMKHFHPDSEQRTKIAIHLVAATTAEEVAAKSDPKEQREKLAATLSQVLGQLGLTVEANAVSKELEKADVSGGDVNGIVGAVGEYLKRAAGLTADQVQAAVKQAPAALQQILPRLGIKTKSAEPEKEEQVNGPITNGEKKERKKTVYIEDVQAWKASVPISPAPRQMAPLSDFEELEPKL